MTKRIDNLLEKFISGKRLSSQEFDLLGEQLKDSEIEQEIFQWFQDKWDINNVDSVKLKFEQIKGRIRKEVSRHRFNKIIPVLTRAAAILFIPLLISTLFIILNQDDKLASSEMLTLITQRGEQSSIIMPDGTKVWLNVDSRLTYPVDYGIGSRQVKLEGEAYFEVAKNQELPFEVISENITTKAIGTAFAISSYPGCKEIRTSLVEGSVKVSIGDLASLLEPGQQFVFNKSRLKAKIQSYDIDEELSWKNNQLIFRLMSFVHVFEELEKWYDIDIEYNPEKFKAETFTVKFKKSETLEQVLHVMGKAGDFKYEISEQTIKIIKE